MYHNGFKGFLYALMEHMKRLSRIKICLRAGMIHPRVFSLVIDCCTVEKRIRIVIHAQIKKWRKLL